MRTRQSAVVVLLPMAGACTVLPPRAPAPPTTCDVWDRELSFADSVARHDTGSFREHLLPGALFVSNDSLLHGPEAIVRGWAKIVQGEGFVLGWRPTTVAFTGDPRVALTRGPYWMEITGATGAKRFLSGTFQSVWVHDVDGVWRVAIDGGTAEPVVTTPQEVERLKAWAPLTCPAGRKGEPAVDTSH
jgi:ketosteroid isomerase-like protein